MKTKDYQLDTQYITVPQLTSLEDSEDVANARVNLQFYNDDGELTFDNSSYLTTNGNDPYNCRNWIAVIETLYKDFELVEDGACIIQADCVIDDNDAGCRGIGHKNTYIPRIGSDKKVEKHVYFNYDGVVPISDGVGSVAGSWHVGIQRAVNTDTYIVELTQNVNGQMDWEQNIVGSYTSLSIRVVHNKITDTYTLSNSFALEGTGNYSYAHGLQILYK